MHQAILWFALAAAVGQAEDSPSPMVIKLQQFTDRQVVSGGVMLVAQGGKLIRADAVGLADIEAQRPMQPNTLFWIASMTKPITATAVMMLQEDGKLSIDDPVGKYLSDFNRIKLLNGNPPQRPVTIADLLSHTSGVANPRPANPNDNPALADIAAAIAKEPLQFEPGSQWKYGSGLTVAGRIVEILSAQPFDDFLEERIFRPLAMHDTTFYPSDTQRDRLATIYSWDREEKKLAPASLSGVPGVVRRAPNPLGGLCSSAPDYYRFLQMIASGGELDGTRILSAAAVHRMIGLATGDMKAGHSPGMGWTLGWGFVREPTGLTAALSPGSFGHGGAFGTIGWIDPTREAVLVMMIARSDMNAAQEAEIGGAMTAAGIQAIFPSND